MIYLRQSTASQEIPLGFFVSSTDGNTEQTALSIANTDIKLWKTGTTTLANKNSGGATHISNGIYHATLDATDTDTIGPMVIFVHVSGALTVRLECTVLDEAVFDVWFGTTAPSTLVATAIVSGGAITTSGGAVSTVTNLTNAATSGDLTATMKSSVNAEVVDALATDTYAEPGSVPAATATLKDKIGWMAALARNKITQTATTQSLRNDADSGNIATSAVSDDGTTFSRSEFV